MTKHFITAQQLLEDSFSLAAKIYQDGFAPNFIIGIWRGGTPVAIAVQEYFEYQGLQTDHISVRTSAYQGINQPNKKVTVDGLHYLVDNVNANDSLLIVDDVFDSGSSIEALINELKALTGENMPQHIRIASPWYKPDNNQVDFAPNYYLHTSDKWLVFPHELQGLTQTQILEGKHELAHLMHLFKKF